LNLLSIEKLRVEFGGIHAVREATFAVHAGEIRGLIGPNGAGKTSIINAITKTVPITGGRIVFDGHDLRQLSPDAVSRIGVGRTFQHAEIFADETVFDNVRVGCDQHNDAGFVGALLSLPGARRAERAVERRTSELLDAFELTRYADQRCSELPFGLLKRVDLARALASRPKLLLLDEPVSGMSETEAKLAIQMAVTLSKRDGIALLIVEHNIRVLMRVAEAVTVVQAGAVIFEGTPAEVSSNALVIEAYLGKEMTDA
jgi:branched-chain amino acid transport system ATP-binding protein